MNRKLLLACEWDDQLHDNQIWTVSPKLDGIRCALWQDVGPRTRSFKEIPNPYVKNWLNRIRDRMLPQMGRLGILALDGEIVVGSPRDGSTWSRTSSLVMSTTNLPKHTVAYRVFDGIPEKDLPWIQRFGAARFAMKHSGVADLNALVLRHRQTTHPIDELDHYVDLGYEGAMLRNQYGRYKHGRSTQHEGLLVKMKKWDYHESTIVDVEELMHNTNEAVRGEDGKLRRSKSQDGLEGREMLGALVLADGTRLGTGFTDEQRQEYWDMAMEGRAVRYKALPPVGKEGKPRHPVFISLGG